MQRGGCSGVLRFLLSRSGAARRLAGSDFDRRGGVHRWRRKFGSNWNDSSARDTRLGLSELGETRKLILASALDLETKWKLLHSLASREAFEAALAKSEK